MKKVKSFTAMVLLITLIVCYATPGMGAETTESQVVPQEVPVTSIILRTIEVYLDGQKAPLNYAAFIDTTARSVISLNDCSLIFGAQIEVIDTRLLLRKGSQEFLLEEGDYLQLPPAQVQEEDLSTIQLDEFYLPMRFVAEQLGYKVKYNSRVGAVIIRSFDYQGPDPQFAPLEPPQLPANLPRWGTLVDVPVMAQLWPAENIIAGYFTSIATSPPSRNHNILLSCNKLNGAIINPGEVCSFNRIVGRRTVKTGYKTASVIVGRRLVPGIGGGVCQTSSTLYNSLLESQIQIVERHPHSLRISYLPANRDATVSWGGADLKFRNNKPYPIKILSQVYRNYVIFAIAA
ncbi:MAG: VanW family protein, partial [Syntrophomonadaceae bacterium]|nr:VanW family protein [Syntrophomonadaceae bacterium]